MLIKPEQIIKILKATIAGTLICHSWREYLYDWMTYLNLKMFLNQNIYKIWSFDHFK